MSIKIRRGKSDQVIEQIMEELRDFEEDHPNAQIELYRQNSVSVRIRIIDADFSSQNQAERSKETWKYLNNLSNETQSDISVLILLTPDETKTSLSSFDFENPIRSRF